MSAPNRPVLNWPVLNWPVLNWPVLNWNELARLVSRINDDIRGLYVERAFIPSRPRFPDGYLKNEWAIRLSGPQSRGAKTLIINVRPRQPYVSLSSRNDLRPAPGATQSVFGLALTKALRGARIAKIETLPRERIVCLWTEGLAGWVSLLIPATPESLLVETSPDRSDRWTTIASTKPARKPGTLYAPPDGAQAPSDPPLRFEWLDQPEAHAAEIERLLEREAFGLRLTRAERELRERLKQSASRLRQTETAISEARHEKDWKVYGDLLKANLHDMPHPDSNGLRKVLDYATGEWVDVPCDPRLDPSSQVKKFYHLAQRKARRLSEAELRSESLNQVKRRAETQALRVRELAQSPGAPDWEALKMVEVELGLQLQPPTAASRSGREKKTRAWLGASFISKDGLPIWIGRSRDENLELTFKHARGNDLWMHVRGRPGAHTLIPVQPGKSIPLETLLDAAILTVYYSGGEKWGKTEVDYTFKKHVKRVKDSTEASYVNNKTLLIEPNAERLKRLLDQRT